MDLERQDGERGYAMAALLVSLAVMSVLLSVILPAWRHEVQREKEAELVFRGEQYARAVALYRAKNANAFPSSIDVLVQGRYLRKKYLDPITNKDFDVIGVGVQSPAQGQGSGAGAGGRGTGAAPAAPASTTQPPGGSPSAVSGGIMGVHSKSQDPSIRIYKGQSRYDQWNFVFTALNRPGGNAPGAANPGGQGGASMPGGRGGGRGSGTGTGTDSGRGGRGAGRGTGPGQGGFELPPTPFPPAGAQQGRGGAGSDLPIPNP